MTNVPKLPSFDDYNNDYVFPPTLRKSKRNYAQMIGRLWLYIGWLDKNDLPLLQNNKPVQLIFSNKCGVPMMLMANERIQKYMIQAQSQSYNQSRKELAVILVS